MPSRRLIVTETRLGPWVRRYLLEHLIGKRNLARNTQQSYRDSLALLIPYIAGKVHKTVDQLEIDHFTAEHIRQFLQHLEEARAAEQRVQATVRIGAAVEFVQVLVSEIPQPRHERVAEQI